MRPETARRQRSSAASAGAPPGDGPVASWLPVADGQLRLWRWPARPGCPKLHFAHATGFHGRTYTPLLETLADRFEVVAWDMRGHGESRALGDPARFPGWEAYYADLCALIDAEGPLLLAGHSVGGVTSLIGAGRRPEAVRGLLLLEPVLLEPRIRFALALTQAIGLSHRFHLARLAARRRRHFESRAAMFAAYQGRGPFRTWPDAWLRAYVEHGVVDCDDGRVELACPPAFESRSFARTEPCPWRRAAALRCPVTLLAGADGSTCGRATRRTLARRYPQARIEVLPGTTHFLPMERPDAVIAALGALGAEDPAVPRRPID